jgi:threonine synthase
MRYTSTRDRSIDGSFETALISGYAPDGGLFVPVALPRLVDSNLSTEQIQDSFLRDYAHLSYPELMHTILRRFIDPVEVSDEELVEVCHLALQGFEDPEHAVRVVTFDEKEENSQFCMSELFHGPTFCFKDLGMRAVIALLGLFAKRRKQCITLIVSTTGDTGPAALQAVVDMALDNPYLKIVVHYPHNQISEFQKRQLLIHNKNNNAQNVRVVAFEGGGDDMDKPIKNMLVSQMESNSNNNSHRSIWTGVNSYNIVSENDDENDPFIMHQIQSHLYTLILLTDKLTDCEGSSHHSDRTLCLDVSSCC